MPATSVVPAIGPALSGKAGYRGGESVRYLRCGIGYHFALRIRRCRELAMKTFVRCGTLFTGREDEARARRGAGVRRRRPARLCRPRGRRRRGARPSDKDDRPFRLLRDAGADRRPHPPRLRQRQERGGHRPLQPARIPHPARHVLRAEGRRRRATPRSARPAMPARSACRSATRSAPACSTVRGSWRRGRI